MLFGLFTLICLHILFQADSSDFLANFSAPPPALVTTRTQLDTGEPIRGQYPSHVITLDQSGPGTRPGEERLGSDILNDSDEVDQGARALLVLVYL